MTGSVNPSSRRGSNASNTLELTALLARVDEKLTAMEDLSKERAHATHLLAQKLETQQTQLNQLTTDMAILRTQHASFWKGATIIFGALSLIGGALGWIIATFLPFIKGH